MDSLNNVTSLLVDRVRLANTSLHLIYLILASNLVCSCETSKEGFFDSIGLTLRCLLCHLIQIKKGTKNKLKLQFKHITKLLYISDHQKFEFQLAYQI